MGLGLGSTVLLLLAEGQFAFDLACCLAEAAFGFLRILGRGVFRSRGFGGLSRAVG